MGWGEEDGTGGGMPTDGTLDDIMEVVVWAKETQETSFRKAASWAGANLMAFLALGGMYAAAYAGIVSGQAAWLRAGVITAGGTVAGFGWEMLDTMVSLYEYALDPPRLIYAVPLTLPHREIVVPEDSLGIAELEFLAIVRELAVTSQALLEASELWQGAELANDPFWTTLHRATHDKLFVELGWQLRMLRDTRYYRPLPKGDLEPWLTVSLPPARDLGMVPGSPAAVAWDAAVAKSRLAPIFYRLGKATFEPSASA